MPAVGEEVEKALSDFVTCHENSLLVWTKSNCSGEAGAGLCGRSPGGGPALYSGLRL